MTEPPHVLVEVADGVAVVTMNRPKERNALNQRLRREVPETLSALDARDDVSVLILTGSDPAFCAGLDLAELGEEGFGRRRTSSDATPRGLPFAELRKPLIGAVNGAAVTGGLEYALCCDLLIASDRARFADTHARVNVMPGWGLTVLLPQAVGIRRARQMSFSGNFIDARTALDWGLVNQVVAHEDLLPTASALARDMASIARASLCQIKRVYRDVADESGQPAALERERRHNREWLANFDPSALANARAGIEARGRAQAKD